MPLNKETLKLAAKANQSFLTITEVGHKEQLSNVCWSYVMIIWEDKSLSYII